MRIGIKGKGECRMVKMTITVQVSVDENGIITEIGKSYLPKSSSYFAGGEVKWYQDTYKKDSKKTE